MTYSTSDLALAATLKANHCETVGFQQSYNRGTWEFQETPEVEKIVDEYYNGTCAVDVHRYNQAIRLLKGQLKTIPNSNNK